MPRTSLPFFDDFNCSGNLDPARRTEGYGSCGYAPAYCRHAGSNAYRVSDEEGIRFLGA